MLRTITIAGLLAGAALVGTAQAEPTDGTTLAGGDNGAAAKADSTAKTQSGMSATKGAPSAATAPGQSTEHPDGKMRGNKEF